MLNLVEALGDVADEHRWSLCSWGTFIIFMISTISQAGLSSGSRELPNLGISPQLCG